MRQIALDGPAGSGKSTLAKKVAEKLGYLHLDSGALYRAIALQALRKGKNVNDEGAITDMAEHCMVYLRFIQGEQRVFIEDEDVTDILRTSEVGEAAAHVAQNPAVRDIITVLIRNIAAQHNVVMDGRDIGTNVLPNTPYKFYITADLAVRAQRRQLELTQAGQNISLQELTEQLGKRDQRDMQRNYAPLVQAKDAYVIDTTKLTIEQAMQCILDRIEALSKSIG